MSSLTLITNLGDGKKRGKITLISFIKPVIGKVSLVSVVLEYTKPRLAKTSVLDEQCDPLVSRLIGGGICH